MKNGASHAPSVYPLPYPIDDAGVPERRCGVRLYDHVVALHAANNGADNEELRDVTECVRIDITNVERYMSRHKSRLPMGRWSDAYPNVRPPFDRIFFEYDLARGIQVGTILHAVTEEDGVRVVTGHIVHNYSSGVVSMGGLGFRVGRDGRGIGEAIVWPPDDIYPQDREVITNYHYTTLEIVFMAISFMHCKNVEMQDAKPRGSRQSRRLMKRHGITESTFKELVIDPSMTQNRDGGGTGRRPQSGYKSLHIARGHFATYTEDAPLFGKYTGTFWRPAHVRGSADAGTVYKDYKVKPPK